MPTAPTPRTRHAAAVVATMLAVAALLLGTTTPARAATTYTPSGGPSITFLGTGIKLTPIIPAQTISCTTFNLGGSVLSPGISRAYGVDAVVLSALSTGGCSNPVCGTAVVTPVGTWSFAITGDATASGWPARLKNVKIQLTCGTCEFTVTGSVNGKFVVSTQRFTPNTGFSGLTVSGSPPPSGTMCAILDVQAGDEVAVGGYWTASGPLWAPLTISNP